MEYTGGETITDRMRRMFEESLSRPYNHSHAIYAAPYADMPVSMQQANSAGRARLMQGVNPPYVPHVWDVKKPFHEDPYSDYQEYK